MARYGWMSPLEPLHKIVIIRSSRAWKFRQRVGRFYDRKDLAQLQPTTASELSDFWDGAEGSHAWLPLCLNVTRRPITCWNWYYPPWSACSFTGMSWGRAGVFGDFRQKNVRLESHFPLPVTSSRHTHLNGVFHFMVRSFRFFHWSCSSTGSRFRLFGFDLFFQFLCVLRTFVSHFQTPPVLFEKCARIVSNSRPHISEDGSGWLNMPFTVSEFFICMQFKQVRSLSLRWTPLSLIMCLYSGEFNTPSREYGEIMNVIGHQRKHDLIFQNTPFQCASEWQKDTHTQLCACPFQEYPISRRNRVFGVSLMLVAYAYCVWHAFHMMSSSGFSPRMVVSRSSVLLGSIPVMDAIKIQDCRPEQIKMDFMLWSRPAVVMLIETGCGLIWTVRTVGLMLSTQWL